MGAYRALAPVFDPETGETHMPGHEFEIDAARGAALVAGGFAAEAPAARAGAGAPDEVAGQEDARADADLTALYEGMTNAQLADILKGRGVTPPSKATKETLVSMLAEGDG